MAIEQALVQRNEQHEFLTNLSQLLHQRAEIFASPSTSAEGAKQIYNQTLEVSKQLFDDALQNERTSLQALAKLLADIRGTGSGAIETRSRSAAAAAVQANTNNAKGKGRARQQVLPMFQQTPLQELYLGDRAGAGTVKSAMDAELEQRMLWEQLEYRNSKVLEIYKEVVQDGDELDEEAEGLDDDEDEDEDEDGLEFEEGDEPADENDGMMLDGKIDIDDDDYSDGYNKYTEEYEDSDSTDSLGIDWDLNGDQDTEDYTTPAPSEPYFAKLRDEAASGAGSPKARGQQGKKVQPATLTSESSLDEGFFGLKDFNSEILAGEEEMRRYMQSGKSKSVNDLRAGLDGLEDLDDSDNESVDYFAPSNGNGLDESDEGEEEEDDEETRPEDMRYQDFWNPPRALYAGLSVGKGKPTPPGKGNDKGKGKGRDKGKGKQKGGQGKDEALQPAERPKRRVSFHDEVKVQEFKSAGSERQTAVAALVKAVGMKEALRRISKGNVGDPNAEDTEEDEMEDEDEDGLEDEGSEEEMDDDDVDDDDLDDDNASQMSEEGGDRAVRTMQRLDRDLLADDEEEVPGKKDKSSQSRYEARMSALSEQIAALEAENVAEKDWTLKGESTSRARPQNSLLEEDLEFDQVAKVVPVVTEESSQTLEDMIRQRIIDEQFDDVVRKRLTESAAYIPSRLLDIKDTQSDRSLTEIYADEFSTERNRAEGGSEQVAEVDAKLQKEHDSIKAIFEDVCGKLDALSNARFTPKQAQTVITTLSNTPSISLESAMPTSMSTATGLAPEEVYAPTERGTLTAKSEMTHSQKKAARVKARKARAQTVKSIEKYGGSTHSVNKAKERAMNSLIGKRGVTVVGKGKAAKSALTGKDRRAPVNGTENDKPTSARYFKL